MKMTFNRRLILFVLSEDSEGTPPPHSASLISYTLENAFNYKWHGIYESMKTIPNKQQIHRTLRELWHGGLIVGSRLKEDWNNDNLPRWVIEYQLSGEVYRNWLLTRVRDVCRQAENAHGTFLFNYDIFFDKPMTAAEKKVVIGDLKALMQLTHPDKAGGV